MMRRGTAIAHLPCLRELLGGVFIATSVSGNYSGAWLTDYGHVHDVRRAPGRGRLGRHPGSIAKGQGEDMTMAPVPVPEPIAEAPADVDGTLVTRTKVVTARPVKAIGRLHERSARWNMRGLMAVFNGRIIVQPGMTSGR
jgi:hypothetical protein